MTQLIPILLAIFCFLNTALTKELSGVFKSLSLEAEENSNIAQAQYTATLDWAIPAAADAQIGDTFSLTMDNVYRVRFGSAQVLRLTAGGTEIARCSAQNGAYMSARSVMSCTVISPLTLQDARGTVSFTTLFGAGGSANPSEIQQANAFQVGSNIVSWNNGELSTTLNLVAGAYYPQSSDSDNQFYSHTTSYNYIETISVSDSCSDYIADATLQLTVTNVELDCSKLQLYMTNDLNAWFMPKSYSEIPNLRSRTCSGNTVTVQAGPLPAGYRIFMTNFLGYDDSQDASFRYTYTYQNTVRCGDRRITKRTTPFSRTFRIVLGSSSSNGDLNNLRK